MKIILKKLLLVSMVVALIFNIEGLVLLANDLTPIEKTNETAEFMNVKTVEAELTVQGFTLTAAQASLYNSEMALTNAGAEDIVLESGEHLVATANTANIETIKNATFTGGFYTQKFSLFKDGIPTTIPSEVVNVVVSGTQTTVTPGSDVTLAITAQGFSVENEEAKYLNSTTAMTQSFVQSMIVETGVTITDITVDATQITDINSATEEGGIYPLTFTSTTVDASGMTITASTTVNVVVKGTYTAVDPVTPEDSNSHSIGLTADGFTLTAEQADSYDAAMALLSGNAKGLVVETGEHLTVTPDIKDIEAINDAPNTGGNYFQRYYVTKDGVTTTITVEVIVEPILEINLKLEATGFTLENKEAKGYNETIAITLGKPIATVIETDETVATDAVDSYFQKITQAAITGGFYKQEYTAAKNDKTANKVVDVVVLGTQTDITVGSDITLAITAQGFSMENEEAKKLSVSGSIMQSYVQSIIVETGDKVEDISVDAKQLEAINKAPKEGGIYPLTFTSTTVDGEGSEIAVSATINVVVEGSYTPVSPSNPGSDTIALTAEGFTLTGEQADVYDEEAALKNSKALGIVVESGEQLVVTPNVADIETINNAPITGGIYTQEYTVTKGEVTLTTKVIVVVEGNQTQITPADGITLVITGVGFTIENEAATTLDSGKAIANGKVISYIVENGSVIKDITVDAKQLEAINKAPKEGGIYSLTFTSTTVDGEGNEMHAKTTIMVIVEGTSVEITPNLGLLANDIEITFEEAMHFNTKDAFDLSGVMGFVVETQEKIDNISIDSTSIESINNASQFGETFTLTFTAIHNGETITKTIVVTVLPKPIEEKDPVVAPPIDTVSPQTPLPQVEVDEVVEVQPETNVQNEQSENNDENTETLVKHDVEDTNDAWSLINLVLTVLTIVFMFINFKRKKEEGNEYKSSKLGSVFNMLPSVVIFTVLLMTQDFTQPMAMWDSFTWLFALITIVQITFNIFRITNKKFETKEESH